MYRIALEKVLVIDDESYVPFDPRDVPARQFFHAKDPSKVPYQEKVKEKAKFPKQFMVWQAIAQNGQVSEPFITDQKMPGDLYLKECIIKRLIPFIMKIGLDRVIFWPDLATCHYANQVIGYLKSKNVNFIQRADNPPNVPQARGIEKFWALCKSEYSRRPNPPKSKLGFARIWKSVAQKVARKSGQAVMNHAWTKLRTIGYLGIDAL